MAKFLQNAASLSKRIRETNEGNDEREGSNKKAKGGVTQQKKAAATTGVSNVIYLGHIPAGFFEKEMKQFFTQYGKVEKVKLFRSKKTGNSKGYAFIRFEEAEVAETVAESMNGYHIQDKQFVSHVVPVEKLHEGMFLYPSKKKSVDVAVEAATVVKTEPKEGSVKKDKSKAKIDSTSGKKSSRKSKQ